MRHIVNFFITAALVWIFQTIGWVHVEKGMSLFEATWTNQLVVAGVIGFIFTIGLWLADLVFGLVVVGTCGIGCFLYPVYLALLGPAGFWAVSKILPGWISLSATTWQIILMGILISFIRIHARRSSSSSSSSS